MKHLFYFGIESVKARIAIWVCAMVAASAMAYLWWPFGAIPFVILFSRSVYCAKKAL